MSFLDKLSMRAMGLGAEVRYPKTLTSTRPPSGALATTQSWSYINAPMEELYSSEQAIERAYMGNVMVWRCVNTIANSIVSCPFRAGDAVSNNYRLTSPLALLLGPQPGSPNLMMSSSTLLRYTIASYILLGKAAWVIERDEYGRVCGLWPLRAQHIKPIPATSGTNYFKEFEYNNRGSDNFRIFKPKDIVYIYHPALSDFRQPEAVVNVAALNINVAKMIDTFDFNFLRNGGVPANLVVTPPFATDTDREGFQAQFQADFSGPQNAGRTHFAEREITGDNDPGFRQSSDDVEVKILGTNQKDSEMNVLRKAQNTAIAIAFSVPMSILGDSTAVTFSNAYQDRRSFWLENLLPKSREIQEAINTQLAPQLGDGKDLGWFDLRQVPELRAEPTLPADSTTASLVTAGAFSWDEWRAERGLVSSAEAGLDVVQKKAEQAAKALSAAPPNPPSNSLSAQADPKKKPAVPPATAPAASAPAASRISPILDSQIRTLMGDQLETAQQKISARHGRVKYTFDREYWSERTRTMIAPAMRAMGIPDQHITLMSQQITQETATEIEALVRDYPSTGTFDNLMSAVDDLFQRRTVACADILGGKRVPVERAARLLLQLGTGTLDLNTALSTLEAR